MKRDLKTVMLTTLWAVLAVAVFVTQLKLVFFNAPEEEKPSIEKGAKVPDFRLSSIDGKKIDLAQTAAKLPVLVIFVSAGSSPCRIELAEVEQYVKNQTEPSFSALVVSDDNKSELKKMKTDLGLSMPVLYDKNAAVMTKYNVTTVPANFLVDKDRKLVYFQYGSEGFNLYKVQALLSFKGNSLDMKNIDSLKKQGGSEPPKPENQTGATVREPESANPQQGATVQKPGSGTPGAKEGK